jgi:hypothetical protein
MYKPLRDEEEAKRAWLSSVKLTGVSFPTDQPTDESTDRPNTRLQRQHPAA